MNINELKSEMIALESAMVEKGIVTPSAKATIGTAGHNIIICSKYDTNPFDGKNYNVFFADIIADCIAAAHNYIAALPSPKDAVTREYLTRVASAVDYATEHSIAEEYVAPLRGVSCAMTDNLLTKEAAQ
jgi:hypothetical protein